jgi:hypothetical protein
MYFLENHLTVSGFQYIGICAIQRAIERMSPRLSHALARPYVGGRRETLLPGRPRRTLDLGTPSTSAPQHDYFGTG